MGIVHSYRLAEYFEYAKQLLPSNIVCNWFNDVWQTEMCTV